jgi:hypothetical protein
MPAVEGIAFLLVVVIEVISVLGGADLKIIDGPAGRRIMVSRGTQAGMADTHVLVTMLTTGEVGSRGGMTIRAA